MPDLNNQILLLLGRIQEGQDRLREDFDAEKRSAAESRRILYQKTDELSKEMSSIQNDLAIAGLTSAQVREEVKALGETVTQHKAMIQPSIEDWKKLKALGLGISGILAVGGLSVGALLAMGVDAVKAAVKSWAG